MAWKRIGRLLVLSLCFLNFGCRGCGPGNAIVREVPVSYQNLEKINSAYMAATMGLNRPPKNLEELLPFLKKEGNPQDILKSPDDGQEYVLFWNVDFRSSPRKNRLLPVIAHEKAGKGGKRYVSHMREILWEADDEFKKEYFHSAQ